MSSNPNWAFLERWYAMAVSRYKIKTYERDGKIFGRILPIEIKGEIQRVYVTERGKEHFYIKKQAFIISLDVYQDLVNKREVGAIFIHYHPDLGGTIWYIANIQIWQELGFPHSDEQTGEEQWALQVKEMTEIKAKD